MSSVRSVGAGARRGLSVEKSLEFVEFMFPIFRVARGRILTFLNPVVVVYTSASGYVMKYSKAMNPIHIDIGSYGFSCHD